MTSLELEKLQKLEKKLIIAYNNCYKDIRDGIRSDYAFFKAGFEYAQLLRKESIVPDKAMSKFDMSEPKFGVDDKIRVCDSIDTIIDDIEWDGTNKCWKYFFTDPTTGKQLYEWEGAIELI